MPEASKIQLQYSRRTIIAAIDVLETRYTQAEITSLLTDFGPKVYRAIRIETAASAKKRMNDLKQFVDARPAHQVDDDLLENVLVERAASLFPTPEPDWPEQETLHPVMEKLKRALEQDGFVITAGSLGRSLPGDIGLPGIDSDLMRLLDRHGLGTAKGHLE
jgi:hypothetical protein